MTGLILAILVSTIAIMLTVTIHAETMSVLMRRIRAGKLRGSRLLHLSIYGMVLAHLVEIMVFAGAFALVSAVTEEGGLMGERFGEDSVDYFYYAAVTYTTLGFGDITPHGGVLRVLTALCSLVGLILVATSATFLVWGIQRYLSERIGPGEEGEGMRPDPAGFE